MTPTIEIPTIPPPVRIPSTGSTARYVPPAPVAPTSKTIKPFPFVPSDWWDGVTEVELQFENPRCAGWRGAVALGLQRRLQGRSNLYVQVTLVELMKLILWSWENK